MTKLYSMATAFLLATVFAISALTINIPTSIQATQNYQVQQPPAARADRFGVYNWNINDSAFPKDGTIDRLNWGANKVAEMGTRTIRVAISTRDDYRINPAGNADLAQIAQSAAYDKLFRDTRFQTYILTAYSRGAAENNWADGYTMAEYETERDEIKRLGEYLIGNSAFANKTFIILNWEGDNAIYYYANKQSIWDAYTRWIGARIEGVKLARQKFSSSNIRLYSGLEFNAVNSLLTKMPCGDPVNDTANNDPLQNRCVIDYVAPQVEADYYSYSSWQSLFNKDGTPRTNLKQSYKEDLDFALQKIRARRPDISESNFIIGEFGFERTRYGECYAANHLNEMFDAFDGPDAFHVSYVIFWQIVDNGRLYGSFDERFGLFRARNQMLTPTLLSDTFQKRIAGQSVASFTGCPRIRQYPEPPGVLNQRGTTEFTINPDTIGSIYVPNCCQNTNSRFSAAGNTVHFNQTLQNYQLPRDNAANFYESPTQVNFSLPTLRRPGHTWVYVTDERGLESNAQAITIECSDCPKIDASCGVLDSTWQTLLIEPGKNITISGTQFSLAGNSVVIEQPEQQQTTRRLTLPRENIISESPTKIIAKLPNDLPGGDALIHIVNAQGLGSAETIFSISSPCNDCGPRLRPCAGIVNESGNDFSTGATATVYGRFAASGNKVVIEQFDQYATLYRLTLTQGAGGWDETDKRIKFELPTTLFPGRVLIYVTDAQGRESRGQTISLKLNPLTSVTATHYKGPSLATEAIVAAFGTSLAKSTQVASTTPLPVEMAGTEVLIKDNAGIERLAPLFFVSPNQINFLMPSGTALGKASITVKNGDGAIIAGTARIVSISPGLFSANANGKGVAAAVALRIKADGTQQFEPVAIRDQTTRQFIPLAIDLGQASDQVFLILFGSGIRARSSLSGVFATIGGIAAEIGFAGAHPTLVGVDQVNLRLSRALAGAGETDLLLSVDGLQANPVRVKIK